MNLLISKIDTDLVTLIHHSTSSYYEIIVKPNSSEERQQSLWFDYSQIKDLITVVERLQEKG